MLGEQLDICCWHLFNTITNRKNRIKYCLTILRSLTQKYAQSNARYHICCTDLPNTSRVQTEVCNCDSKNAIKDVNSGIGIIFLISLCTIQTLHTEIGW